MTTTDRQKLASDAAVYVAAKIIAGISKIAAVVILARSLDKPDFGAVSFVLLTYFSVSALAKLGIHECIFFFFGEHPENTRRSIVLHVTKLLFALSVPASLVLLFISATVSEKIDGVLALSVPLAILMLMELPTAALANILVAIDRAGMAAGINVVFGISLLVTLAVPAWFERPLIDIMWYLLLYGAFRLCVYAYLISFYLPASASPPAPGTMRRMLSYSVPLGVAQMCFKLNQYVDKYVVMLFLPVVVFAEYSVGSWEIPFIPTIGFSVAVVMMPQFTRMFKDGQTGEMLDLWSLSIQKVSLIVLPMMMIFILISRELIVLLFGAEYSGAAVVFSIYTLVLFQRVTAYGAILKAINQTRVITRWALYTLVLNTLLCIVFVPWMGMTGAALSTLLASLAGWLYVLKEISLKLDVSLAEVFPFGRYLRVLVLAVASAAPCFFLRSLPGADDSLILLLKILAYLTIFCVLGAVTGTCRGEDWRGLFGLLKMRNRIPA